jgi:hypothetical protein
MEITRNMFVLMEENLPRGRVDQCSRGAHGGATVNKQETLMKNDTKKSEVESRKLSLKKETLQHLKVRTDLKGGLVHAALKCCAQTHSCAG